MTCGCGKSHGVCHANEGANIAPLVHKDSQADGASDQVCKHTTYAVAHDVADVSRGRVFWRVKGASGQGVGSANMKRIRFGIKYVSAYLA